MNPNFATELGLAIAAIAATLSGNAKSVVHPEYLSRTAFANQPASEANVSPGHVRRATPMDYGAEGDATTLTDGTISAGSAMFSSASAKFTVADVGKPIAVSGAGPSGNALVTVISTVTSAARVTLGASAFTTVSQARTDYGTDDTAAVRSCVQHSTLVGGRCTINDGGRFMMSSTATTIHISGASVSGGIIDGKGTLIFAPQGNLTGGSNDRLFYVASSEAAGPFQVRGPILRGATSFTAQNSRDAAQLSKGDWVIITEKDAGATDIIYSDWLQVAGVAGTTVNVVGHFRMSFPNGRTFNAVATPSACVAASPCGLSFRKVSNVVNGLTIKDISIVVPKVINGNGAIGISTRDTRGTQIRNVSCYDSAWLCYSGFLDQALVFTGNSLRSAVYPEFAGQVDASVVGNHFEQAGNGLQSSAFPQTGGLLIDFGTGFSTFDRNTVGDHLQACFTLLSGVHDVLVTGNTCGRTFFGTGATCILVRGSYRNKIEHNTCVGGDGASVGITVADSTGFTLNIGSSANSVMGNSVKGYATGYDVRSAADRLGAER